MKNYSILFWAFWAMVIIQLGFPLRTVFQHESTLHNGNAYKFPTVPVDPNDPFRGKYVALDFPALEAELPAAEVQRVASEVSYDQSVYILVTSDERGYVKATGLQTTEPDGQSGDYFTAKVQYVTFPQTDSDFMDLEYPFTRFFLEEFKAPAAEEKYWEALRDTSMEVYAKIRMRGGISVLEDVFINGKSIRSD